MTDSHEDDAADQTPMRDGAKLLRWWPAALLLAAMALIKTIPMLIDSPSFPVMIAGFMGPAAIGILIPFWWLLASRAGAKEKLVGAVGLLAIAALTIFLVHFSMQGMTVVLFQLPVGIACFAVPLVLLAYKPNLRLGVALACSLVGFGAWDFLQMHGTNGKFAAELDWRWAATAEEEYVRSLGENRKADANDAIDENVDRSMSPWPEFRGPSRNSDLAGIVLDEDWETNPPKQLWKTRVGPGWSSFSVAGNRLFTQEQRGDVEAVVCLNTETGETLWSYEYPGRFWEAIGGAGPRGTPTIGNNLLYSLGANGDLTALRPATGKLVWQRDLKEDADRKPPTWGWSSSPLLIGTLVVVHAGGDDDKGVLAYSADTGDLVWSAASGDHTYSSPQAAEIAGTEGILMVSNDGLQCLAVDSGKAIWNHDWEFHNYRVSQPLVLGDSVLIATSMGIGTRKLTIQKTLEEFEVKEEWTSRAMKPDYNDFVAHQGHLYGFDGSIFASINLETGEKNWKRGRYGNGQVLLLSETGQLLITSEKGELVLLKATPGALTEIAKYKALEGKTWNHPVLVGNRLYVRNGQEAACFEMPTVAQQAQPATEE